MCTLFVLSIYLMHSLHQLGALLAQEGLLSAPVTLAFDKLSVTIAGNEVLRNVSGVIAPGACGFKSRGFFCYYIRTACTLLVTQTGKYPDRSGFRAHKFLACRLHRIM